MSNTAFPNSYSIRILALIITFKNPMDFSFQNGNNFTDFLVVNLMPTHGGRWGGELRRRVKRKLIVLNPPAVSILYLLLGLNMFLMSLCNFFFNLSTFLKCLLISI